MRRIMMLVLTLVVVACGSENSFGTDPYARKHAVTTKVVTCANNAAQRSLAVSWVDWNWQAIFLKGAQQVASVTDSALTHSSGCVYAVGDKARVKLVPLNGIQNYLDSAFVDVDIK
jgi:hypothetical protein